MSSTSPPRENYPGVYPDGLTYKFNASMAIIVVVLVTTFFFMALFVLYIRRCNMVSASGWNTNPNNGNPQQQQQHQQQQAIHHGLDAETLQKLPLFRYSSIKSTKRGKAGPDCAVCLLQFEESETVRLLPDCGHLFHSECIDMWLETHSTCPLCRRNLDPKSVPANLQRALSAVMSSFRRQPSLVGASLRVDDSQVQQSVPPPPPAAAATAEGSEASSARNDRADEEAARVVRTLSMHSESFNKALHDMDLIQVREQLRAKSIRFHHSKSFGNLPEQSEQQGDDQQHQVKIDISGDEETVGLRRSVSDGQFLKQFNVESPARDRDRDRLFPRRLRRSLKWLVGSSSSAQPAPEQPDPKLNPAKSQSQ